MYAYLSWACTSAIVTLTALAAMFVGSKLGRAFLGIRD